MSTTKRRRRRRKRSYTTRQETTDSQESQDSEISEPPPKKTKYDHEKYGDYRRRSDRIRNKRPNYNDDDQFDNDMIDTDEDEEPSNNTDNVPNEESDANIEEEEEDDVDDLELHSDEYNDTDDLNNDNNDNHTNQQFPPNLIRNHRTIRCILNNDELNEEEIAFKTKAYQYVNNQFETNFKNSKQLWIDQKNKYQTEPQPQTIKILPFARATVIPHASFLNDVAQNVTKTAKYLHITGYVDKDWKEDNASDNEYDEEKNIVEDSTQLTQDDKYRIDAMIEPIEIPLNEETCPIPRCTSYVTVNRNHYIKDDAKLRYIPLIGADMEWDQGENSGSDTEFEEQEDILLDYIYENLQLDDDETVALFEKVFYLSFERIQHRIMALTHHKEKLLKQQKKSLLLEGFDTKNKDIPIDSFSLLFCPRCMTYDCSLHGLDNARRRERALPSDTLLTENCDYFGVINKDITEPNALAVIEGNHSLANHMIPCLLPNEYAPSVIYPQDLSECIPCRKDCYITYIKAQHGNKDKYVASDVMDVEWSYMDLANLRRLLNICKKNFCQIASILHTISCKNVYLKSMELIPDLVPYIKETKDAKRRKKAPAAMHMNREAAELNAENVPRQFFGCKHEGSCSADNNCSCIMNQTHCEKYCICDIECKQRFPGCNCAHGECKTDKCPCFRSHRECDPDKCIDCQSYLTPNVFNKAIDWLKNNDSQYYYMHYKKNKMMNEVHKQQEETEEKTNTDEINKYEDVKIEIDGIPNINPYKLCRNLCCTQQRKKKLWIGRSEVHGFGCFAGETILKDEYVTEYQGEMITQTEADRRGRVYDEQNISYLFNLNEEYCIDATRKGSKMKFANHSIKPNCRAKIITVNGDHRICIYAKKDLQLGQELLFDYRHDNVDSAQQPNWFHHNQK